MPIYSLHLCLNAPSLRKLQIATESEAGACIKYFEHGFGGLKNADLKNKPAALLSPSLGLQATIPVASSCNANISGVAKDYAYMCSCMQNAHECYLTTVDTGYAGRGFHGVKRLKVPPRFAG